MTKNTRRTFLSAVALGGLAVSRSMAAGRKFQMAIVPGSIGVAANQVESIELAQRFGFESVEDLLTMTNEQIVSADLNDAPQGLAKEDHHDNQRDLPMATGVIDQKGFPEALVKIGYDGPIRAEPFNKALNELPNEEASRRTGEAMKRAFALVG